MHISALMVSYTEPVGRSRQWHVAGREYFTIKGRKSVVGNSELRHFIFHKCILWIVVVKRALQKFVPGLVQCCSSELAHYIRMYSTSCLALSQKNVSWKLLLLWPADQTLTEREAFIKLRRRPYILKCNLKYRSLSTWAGSNKSVTAIFFPALCSGCVIWPKLIRSTSV